MRAGFELYHAFDQDGDDNRAALTKTGKLKMPVLALGGASSSFASVAADMLSDIADDVRVATISRCAHWIAGENPTALLDELQRFLG